jgi:hypothetical protein
MSKTRRFRRKSEELKHLINIVQIADIDKRTGRHLHQYGGRRINGWDTVVRSLAYKGTT